MGDQREYTFNPNFLSRVAQGLVPGWSFNRKFGSIDAIQATVPADVWEYGVTVGAETYTFSADGVADIDSISSSNIGDAIEMTVNGLDISGNDVTQTVTTDGQNRVPLTTALWRVNRVYNSNGVSALGNIYVYVNGAITVGVPNDVTTVRGYVSIGEGQTLQAVYTVPVNMSAWVLGLETSLTKGAAGGTVTANLRGRTRELGGVLRTQDEFNLISTGNSGRVHNFSIALPFPGGTDFIPVADVSTNDVGISWAYTVLLNEN